MLQNINSNIIRLNGLVIPLDIKFDQFRDKVEKDFQMQRDSMDSLKHSISNLSTCLQEHKEQTQTEMTSLKTSLNSTQASIDNLTTCLQEHKQQTQTEIMNLQISFNSHQVENTRQLNNKLDAINSTLNSQIDQSVSNLTTCLQEHRQQTQNEMTSLKTFFNSTQASIDNLTTCLQEHKQQTQTEMTSLNTSLNSSQASIDNLTTCLQEHKQQTQTSLKTSLNSTQASIDKLNTCLQEHKQQTATELSHLQTSLTSTHSKLDTLTNTTASDHQQIIDSMPDVECLENNLTHQLEKIQDDVTFIREQHWFGDHGWRRVVYLNMTNPHTTCPSGWQLTGYSKRTCGRVSTGAHTCDSATFPVSGGPYNRICGMITAYQYGDPDAFANTGRSIDQAYACGVSVTHGTPRNHICTFAAGTSEGPTGSSYSCPCDSTVTITIPQFVGNDYFCESGINEPYNYNIHRILHPNDRLWDGEDCLPSSTCCSLHNPPYFVKQLPTSTTDNIEARICVDDAIQYTNIAVELVELYVQ